MDSAVVSSKESILTGKDLLLLNSFLYDLDIGGGTSSEILQDEVCTNTKFLRNHSVPTITYCYVSNIIAVTNPLIAEIVTTSLPRQPIWSDI